MFDTFLELHFEGITDVELVETRFAGTCSPSPQVAIRGKTMDALTNIGTFQWTSAVRALCVLCIRAALETQDPDDYGAGKIAGFKGSLAASLDYALSKQPAWLRQICGVDSQGYAYARRLFVRSNSERKRPGPVVVGINPRVLPTASIHLFWNGHRVEAPDRLRDLLEAIDNQTEKPRPIDFLARLRQKQVA